MRSLKLSIIVLIIRSTLKLLRIGERVRVVDGCRDAPLRTSLTKVRGMCNLVAIWTFAMPKSLYMLIMRDRKGV